MTREEIEKMTDEEKRIKIAELCGWTACWSQSTGEGGAWVVQHPEYHHGVKVLGFDNIPDYLNDFNAIHEAVKSMEPGDELRWTERLRTMEAENGYNPYNATAAQRCEAFLMVMG